MSSPARALAAIAVAVAASLALAGCGLVSRAGTAGVTITITRDFGARVVRVIDVASSGRSMTALALLRREARVRAARDGQVLSIDGLAAAPGQRWSEFVNGVGTLDGPGDSVGPNAHLVHPGDRLWWDLRDREAGPALQTAVVGAFPEPFRHGVFGKRFPTTVECAADATSVCTGVAAALVRAGTPAATQELGTGSGQDTVSVLVGTWDDLRGTLAADLLAAGPRVSGVYARFARGGTALVLEDAAGRARRTLSAGAGLLAAIRDNSAAPTWLITGTDLAGVRAAARALTPAALRDHYAIALAGGDILALPLR